MKVVLRAEVPSLGRRGDICDVADGYAQNYLIPRGLAIRATRGSEREAEAMRRRRELADAAVLSQAREMAERLTGSTIRVVARAERWLAGGCRIVGGCCGSTPEHIAALRRVVDAAV